MSSRTLLSVLFVLVLPSTICAQEAVVKIYTTTSSGGGQGTGFLVTGGGQIVTAYHVIVGARKIEVVHDQLGTYADIMVEFISPDFDLAVLQVLNPVTNLPHLRLADAIPDLTQEFTAEGYPRAGMKQRFRTHATRAGFVSSQTIIDERQRAMFDGAIDVVSLDLTIYSGMSGSPVVGRDGVIGVLSGSYNEGGGIAWAIPTKYLQQLQVVKKKPADISVWPALRLMSKSWKSLRSNVRLNASANAVYDQFVNEVEDLAACYQAIQEQSAATLINFSVLSPFLEQVIADSSLSNHPQRAAAFLDAPESNARASFGSLVDLFNDCDATQRNTALATSALIAWVMDESNLSEARGQELGLKIRKVRESYSDIGAQSLDQYVGIDREGVFKALPGISQDTNSDQPIRRARGLLRLIDTFKPILQGYGSARGFMFTSRTIGRFRQIARIFEPIVYQAVETP